MFEKEAEIEFQKLPLTEREKLVSVVQVWNKAFVSGANFGFQKCAKSRLNITTISDAPIDYAINEKYGDSYGEKLRQYEDRIEQLKAQIEKLIDFVLSKTECCDVCPITDTCINSEGTCPYAGILAKGEEGVTREWLMQFILRR